jgi:hypothetical protein
LAARGRCPARGGECRPGALWPTFGRWPIRPWAVSIGAGQPGSTGLGPLNIQIRFPNIPGDFPNTKNYQTSKIQRMIFLMSKKFQTYPGCRKNSKGTTFMFGPTSKFLSILNYKIQEKIQFETYLNFKGVQIFLGKIS